MTDAGCEVVIFRPLSLLVVLGPFGFGKDNNRSHRRILVVDGRVGFTGGVGVSPSWTGNGRTKDHWRQTDVRIEGPVVASLQGAFVENWLEATGTVLGGEAYFPRLAPHGTVTAQVVPGSPAEVNLVVYSPDVAARLERVFADDLGYAKRIDPETWRYRGAWERVLEAFSLPVRREF